MKKKQFSLFTMVELLVVLVIMSLVFLMILSIYSKMIVTKVDVEAKQSLIQNSYSMLEKLSVVIKDYTIDYEEYFNRRIVWCNWANWWDSFLWNVNNKWYCPNYTYYGNKSWLSSFDWSALYYCTNETLWAGTNPDLHGNYIVQSSPIKNWNWCWSWDLNITPLNNPQSYYQYKYQYFNYWVDIDGVAWVIWDDDDEDLWVWPVAVWDNNSVKELYLISKDWKNRLFLRRNLIWTGNFDWKWTWWDYMYEKWYNIQMLKLRWFDAWSWHDFTDNDRFMYDWVVDTWACDYSQGFKWNWNSIKYWWTDNYKLPNDNNDCWVNIFWKDLTIADWNLQIYPNKYYWYSWNENWVQINPYIRIQINTKIYGEPWYWKVNPVNLSWYQMTLQTTLNVKSNY